MNEDGSFEMRTDAVARDKPDTDGTPGKLNVRKTKARARDMINNGTGNPLPPSKEREKRREEENAKGLRRQLRLLQEMQEFGDAIRMNLLEKSGLADDRVLRDLNLLEDSINEASHHLNTDELRPALDRHFGLDNLKESDHQQAGRRLHHCCITDDERVDAPPTHRQWWWLSGVSDLAAVKNDVNVVRRISREWNQIMHLTLVGFSESADCEVKGFLNSITTTKRLQVID